MQRDHSKKMNKAYTSKHCLQISSSVFLWFRRMMNMLNDEIIIARNKLNKFIEENKSQEEIYRASQELDKLIVQYYQLRLREQGT